MSRCYFLEDKLLRSFTKNLFVGGINKVRLDKRVVHGWKEQIVSNAAALRLHWLISLRSSLYVLTV